jgi:6-phospho-beta-glucosidase
MTILGGSSPFTSLLFLHASVLKSFDTADIITLQGRDDEMLRNLVRNSSALLGPAGPSVRYVCDLEEALAEAEVVLVQSRFGGTRWRANVDRICASNGFFSDETLGIGGLATGIMYREEWRQLGQKIAKVCPDCLVLNMINPLSLSCYFLQESGLHVVGLCEGPWQTMLAIADKLECDFSELSWCYTGLNHRGYIHSLRVAGLPIDLQTIAEIIPDLAGRFVPELGAIQSKEFCKSQVRALWKYDRSAIVESIRSRLCDYLRCGQWTTEQLLGSRPTPWYSLAVLPFLAAWSGRGNDWCSTANVQKDGVFVEVRSVVRHEHLSTTYDAYPSEALAKMVEAILFHERQCLKAISRPSQTNITEALASDPTIAPADVARARRAIVELCRGKEHVL